MLANGRATSQDGESQCKRTLRNYGVGAARSSLDPRLSTCSCLELGCGSGFVITSLALLLRQLSLPVRAQLLAIDHSPAAAEATAQTLHSHQVRRRSSRTTGRRMNEPHHWQR